MNISLHNINEKIIKPIIPSRYYLRPMMKYIKERSKDNKLIGAEIGVLYGNNAICILENLNIELLYLIDYKFPRWVIKRFRSFNDRVIFLHCFSSNAVDKIADDLDFVYIDGDHSYNGVKEDIGLYYPKVTSSGVIGGHDFDANHIGLVSAVVEFGLSNNLKLSGKDKDWWIRK